ncbi:MAG: serine protease [Bacteroidota bacterium]
MKSKILLIVLALAFWGSKGNAQVKGLDAKMIAANYYKGVVKILLFDSLAEKKKPGGGYIGRGTGFFVTDDGIIFTNRHVVEYCVMGYIDYDYKDSYGQTQVGFDTYTSKIANDPNTTKVYATGYTTPIVQVYWGKGESDYTLYAAQVLTIGTGSFDGAMIKIVSDLKGNKVTQKFLPLPIGNSDAAQQGEDLCVYGYPAQYDGGWDMMVKDMSTLTFGKFSGLDYVFNKDYGYIKTDASINGGNSGGPVFNETNKVIGIATAVGNKTGIGLVGGINGMYYVVAPKSAILTQLNAKGLTIPKNAGSINTIMGDKQPILTPDQINATKTGGNTTTYNTDYTSSSSGTYSNCDVYTTNEVNESTGTGPKITSFEIPSDGAYIYVVVDNGSKSIETDHVEIDVYKDVSGTYTFQETKKYDLSKSTLTGTWMKYTLYSAGSYRFDVYNHASAKIGTAYCTVSMKGGGGGNSNSTVYYASSSVYCSDSKPNSSGYAPSYTTFNIDKGKSQYIYLVISNGSKTMGTDGIIVYLDKKVGGEWKQQDKQNYTITSDLNYTYLEWYFSEKGEYQFAVYTKDMVWINNSEPIFIKYK